MNSVNEEKVRICFRCKLEDRNITAICLNCKKAIYCNRKCMKKNRKIHDMICRVYIEKSLMIKSVMESMTESFSQYKNYIKNVKSKIEASKNI